MAVCKSIGEVNEDALFNQSFGQLGVQHKQCFHDPYGLKSAYKIDYRTPEVNQHVVKSMRGMKAQLTTAGGAGTAGYAMIPVFVDPLIIDQTRKYTPLTELVPRVANRGMYADYNNITAKGGAFTAAEGAALNETDTTYDRFSTAIKFLYAVGAVTGQTNVAQPGYELQGFTPTGGATGPFQNQMAPNAKQQKILEKTREIKELEENLIVNGNATTSGISGNPNGTEYNGIVTLMSTTNTVAKGTTDLQLSDVTKAARYAYDDGGRPNLGVASSAAYEDLQNLIIGKFGYLKSEKEVFWGVTALVMRTIVGEIPVIPSMYLSNTSGSKAIYFLDMTVVEMRVLQDLTYFDLAKTNDTDRFALKMYEALIIRNTAFCASITAIK